MHRYIWLKYLSLSRTTKKRLGALVTDETSVTRDIGRYSAFQGGFLFGSPKTGVRPVLSVICRTYSNNGGAASRGFPTADGAGLGLEEERRSALNARTGCTTGMSKMQILYTGQFRKPMTAWVVGRL